MNHPLRFVDALRGYAVLLVMACHAYPAVVEMPWAVKRISNLGFYGVQLFFVVSAFTLARSWRRREVQHRPSLRDFALRRVFRIAPLFFLAAAFYALWRPQPGVDAVSILTLLTFTNGWSPATMPTVAGHWMLVPGGWSVAVEFGFYMAFPVLVALCRGWRRTTLAVALSLGLAFVLNALAEPSYTALYGGTATGNFLYYWLPNQLPVFLCGLLAYELVTRLAPGGPWQEAGRVVGRCAPALVGCSVLAVASLAFVSWPRVPVPQTLLVHSLLLVGLAFAVVTVALACRPLALLVNAPIVYLGRISFSCYLTHFAVLDVASASLPSRLVNGTDYIAILAGTVLLVLTVAGTAVVATATYRLVELPGIALGGRVAALASRIPLRAGVGRAAMSS